MHIMGALVKGLMEMREYVRKMFYKREDRKSKYVCFLHPWVTAQQSNHDKISLRSAWGEI